MEEKGQIDCVSCGRVLVGPSGQGVWFWGHSHNLPVGQYQKLESDPNNFKPRCQNWGREKGCHEKLDDRDFKAIAKFDDLDQIMNYRLKHDIEAYNQFVTGLNEAGVNPGYEYGSHTCGS
jgi:hypothetical protein